MQSVDDAQKLEFSCATFADLSDIRTLVEAVYRGDASSAGWTTEADLLDKRSR